MGLSQRSNGSKALHLITPVFVFDSKERWFPCAVETILEVPGVKLDNRPLKSLSQLGLRGSKINFPAGMEPITAPAIGYHTVKSGGGLFWHQYWLFYLYNQKNYLVGGEHEGDWEFVQIGCCDLDGSQPILMTCSQHKTGGKREYWRVLQHEGRPVVYVARGSHANYFTPTQDEEDIADGKGKQLDIEWKPFGSWANWPGLWGNSTGIGKSPESPAHQTVRWNQPHIFHGQARG